LAQSGGTHAWDDVAKGVFEGRYQFWPKEGAAVVTEVVTYPRKKVLHVFLAGGELAQIIDLQPEVAAWAKTQGCTGFTQAGRYGFHRALKDHGWRTKFVVMEKDF
jgi:hypothetical protein